MNEYEVLDEALEYLNEFNSKEEKEIENKTLKPLNAQEKRKMEEEEKKKENDKIEEYINSPYYQEKTKDEEEYDKWENNRY